MKGYIETNEGESSEEKEIINDVKCLKKGKPNGICA